MAKDKSLLLLNKISKVSVLKSISNNNNFQDHLIKSRFVALSLNYLSQTAPNNEEVLKRALEKKFKELNASISASFENLVPGYESEYYPQCGYLWSIAPYATGTENFDKKLSQMTDKIHTGLLSKEGNIKTTVSAVAYCIQASLDKNNYLKKAHLNDKETEILSVIMKDNFNLNANLNCVDKNRIIPWVNHPKTEAPLEKCIENGTFFHNLRIFQILNKVENLESMNF